MRQVLSKLVGPDPPFSISNAAPPPISSMSCIRRSSLPSNLLLSPLTFRLRQTTSQLIRHTASTNATPAPIEPPMAAPCGFELDEVADELGESSVAFPDELAVAGVRREVALVARPD